MNIIVLVLRYCYLSVIISYVVGHSGLGSHHLLPSSSWQNKNYQQEEQCMYREMVSCTALTVQYSTAACT